MLRATKIGENNKNYLKNGIVFPLLSKIR